VNKFWHAAVAVCGFSAVAAFVFWSLYEQWLSLAIFEKLTQKQTFILMLVFLVLTFFALVAMLLVYLKESGREKKADIDLQTLTKIWSGIRAPNLSNPNLDMAHRAITAMSLIAWHWDHANAAERKLIRDECLGPYQQWFSVLETQDLPMSDGRSSKEHVSGKLTKAFQEMKNGARTRDRPRP